MPFDPARHTRSHGNVFHDLDPDGSISWAEHRAVVFHLRSSPEFQLGKAIIDLRTLDGWQKLPKRVFALVSTVRKRARKVESVVPEVSPRRSLKVAAVLDQFSMACLRPEFAIVQPRADEAGPVEADLLFAESAWNGNAGAWAGEFSRYSEAGALARLLKRSRSDEIPTVFWNKEDPLNYEVFISAAKKFDFVFTTDVNCIPRYRRDLDHDRVGLMMFGAQPHLHNPLNRTLEQRPTACFAGSWRGEKYPARARQLTYLLEAANELGALVIYDREPQKIQSEETFPRRFQHTIAGNLGYSDMVQRYRQHRIFLNTNSEQNSPTMMSRRVFEILACGTPVVSTPSKAVETHFADIVATPSTEREAREVIELLLNDDEYHSRIAHLGYRVTHSEHTYEHRINDMLEILGLGEFSTAAPTVGVLFTAENTTEIDQVAHQIEHQGQKIAEVFGILPANILEYAERRLTAKPHLITRKSKQTDGEAIRQCLAHCTADYLAIMAPKHLYGRNYLSDLMLAAHFSGAAVVGKAAYYEQSDTSFTLISREAEFTVTTALQPASLLLHRRSVCALLAHSIEQRDPLASIYAACHHGQLTSISTDRYNFVRQKIAGNLDPTHFGAEAIGRHTRAFV